MSFPETKDLEPMSCNKTLLEENQALSVENQALLEEVQAFSAENKALKAEIGILRALLEQTEGHERSISKGDLESREFSANINSNVVCDNNGRTTALQGMFTGSSDRKRDEETLLKSEQRFKLLSEANSLLLSSKEPKAIIQTIAEQVMHHLNCDVFFNYVFDEVREKLHLNAYAGICKETAKEIEWLDIGSAICGCVALEGCRIVSEDVQNNGDKRADLVRSMGVRAYSCQPLRTGKKTIGTLSFGTKSRQNFTKNELALMGTVASQVSVAIDRKQSEDLIQTNTINLERAERLANLGHWDWDLTTNEVKWSDGHFRIFGYNVTHGSETYEMFRDRVHPEDLEFVEKQLREDLDHDRDYNLNYRLLLPDGAVRYVHAEADRPVKDASGKPVRWFGIVQDITKQKLAEEALSRSETKYRQIVETAQEGIWLVDCNNKTVFINQKVSDMLGYSVEEILGQWPQKFMSPEFLENPHEKQQEHLQGVKHIIDSKLVRKDGSDFWCILSSNPLFDSQGKYTGALVLLTDITERKRVEKELQESKEQLSAFLEQVPVGIGLFDTQGRSLINNEMFRCFAGNFGTEPDSESNWHWRSWGADGRLLDRSEWPGSRALRGENVTPGLNFLYRSDSGREFWTRVSAIPFRNEKGEITGIISVIQDIDSQKRAEEMLNKTNEILEEKVIERTAELEKAYNSLLENELRLSEAQKIAHFGYWELNLQTDELYLSDEIYLITGIDPLKFGRTYNAFLSLVHPDDRSFLDEATRKALTGEPYSIEYRIILPDGETRTVHSQGEIVLNEKYSPLWLKGVLQDITERKKAQEALEKIEKMRIKEIHHRIKNNLQVISSLLDLQADKFEEEKVKEAFKEGQNRVISMSLLHEELYKGQGNDKLDFSAYLKKLAENLFKTYNLYNQKINLSMELEEDAFFDMDTAVPLGIIVNELISNSLKHAFTEKKEGEIKIRLCRAAEVNKGLHKPIFHLTVSDNGKGIPEDLDLENIDSLGLQLVGILVDQLDGKIELKRTQGTEFRISFNADKSMAAEHFAAEQDEV